MEAEVGLGVGGKEDEVLQGGSETGNRKHGCHDVSPGSYGAATD
jgi:hypothetical protein